MDDNEAEDILNNAALRTRLMELEAKEIEKELNDADSESGE